MSHVLPGFRNECCIPSLAALHRPDGRHGVDVLESQYAGQSGRDVCHCGMSGRSQRNPGAVYNLQRAVEPLACVW